MNLTIFKKLYFYLAISTVFTSESNNQKDYHTNPETQVVKITNLSTNNADLPQDQEITDEQHTITVWVHGTSTLSGMIFSNFFNHIPGLNQIDQYNELNSLYHIAQSLNQGSPTEYPIEDIYLFGWEGKLSPVIRKKAAIELYVALLELKQKYKIKYGSTPKIRLMTHSHGGNVALYLAWVANQHAEQLEIDELILLACPVQERTKNLISSHIFHQVISIYSSRDLIQVLDPQGFSGYWPFFSGRRFNEQKNLIQTRIKVNGRYISHIEFILRKFVKQLPQMLITINDGVKNHNSSKKRANESLLQVTIR